jgi:hypothetical protein
VSPEHPHKWVSRHLAAPTFFYFYSIFTALVHAI